MFSLVAMIIFTTVLANLMMFLALNISKKKQLILNKMTAFECGFTPPVSPRLPLSMHFFFIALIFLIFDIEIVLIMPMMLIMKINNIFFWSFMCTYFMILLLLSIFNEWNQMMLNWNS
uniref:NADH-ubiquinone oxidoreductase chain 3 n=1 Tax=Hydroptila sp. XG-2021 TaxID=2996735 RepID=A0A9E8LNY1_9NEOP|nr:NADH dehydrogenase subunit 3 [Hydroptila sp. XG-2021]